MKQEYIDWYSNGNTIIEINDYAAKRALVVGKENVYNFTIGSPSTEPPEAVEQAVKRIKETMDPVALHAYVPAPGIRSVREKFASYLNESFSMDYTADDIFVTCGASSALAILTRVLVDKGDEAIVIAPYFPDYRFYIEASGGVCVEVKSEPESFQLDLAALEEAISEKTTMLIVNSPNNPTGAILSEDTLKKLAELLERKQREFNHPIYVIADEPYRELVYDDMEVPFLPSIYDNTIYCYSFSKSLSLPGDRIGFLAAAGRVADHDNLFAAVNGVNRSFGYLCITPLLQIVAAECIGKTSDLSVYAGNRELLKNAFDEMGFEYINPDGAFYIYLKSPIEDDREFCKKAMDMDLLFVPGSDFGYAGYCRLAYCVRRDMIERSLPTFKKLAEFYGLK